MLPDPSVVVFITLLILPVLFYIGSAVSKVTGVEQDISNVLIFPIVGYVTISILLFLSSQLFGFSQLLNQISVVIVLMASVLYLFKSRQKLKIPRFLILIWVIALIGSLVCVSGVFIKQVGADFLVSFPLFDHAKVAIVNSILREGLPVENPFCLGPDGDGRLHYYYAWYFSASIIASLFSISGYTSVLVNTWLTGIFLFSTILAIFFELNQKVNITHKLLFICSVLLVIIINLPQFPYPSYFIQHHSLETFTYQLSWVPQHVFSAVLVCVFVLFWEYFVQSKHIDEKKFSSICRTCLLLAMVASWAFGSSVYVGGILFFAICLVLLIEHFLSTRTFIVVIKFWLTTGIFTIALSSSFLLDYLLAIPTEGESTLIFSLWRSVDGSVLLNLLSYFTVTALVYFGLIYCGFIGWFINRDSFKGKRKKWIWIALISLIFPLIIKSAISNNDFGWRTILPFLMISSAFLLTLFVENLKLRFIIIIVAFLQLSYGISWYITLMHGERKFVGDAVASFHEIEENTEKTGRVLLNTFSWDAGKSMATPVLLDRKFAYLNWSYGVSLGEGGPFGRSNLAKLHEDLNAIFEKGELPAISVLRSIGMQYLVVGKDDKIFNSDIHTPYFEQVYSSERVKIYECQTCKR